MEVFNNLIVWRHLSKYLSLGDLKEARLTSRNIDSIITSLQKFRDCTLTLPTGILVSPNFAKFASKFGSWNKIRLTIDGSEIEDLQKFSSFFKGTETLLLHFKYLPELDDNVDNLVLTTEIDGPVLFDDGRLDRKMIQQCLNCLLGATSNLENLEIESDIYVSAQFDDALSERFKKIKSLKLLPEPSDQSRTFLMISMVSFPEPYIQGNLESLESLFLNPAWAQTYTICRNFFQSRAENLKHLNITEVTLPMIHLKDIEFPRLESLAIKICRADTGDFVKLFHQLPNLKEFSLETKEILHMVFLLLIKEKCQLLESLSLKSFWFNGGGDEGAWAFLKKLENLKEFRLRHPYEVTQPNKFVDVNEILKHLPSKIRKVYLEGCGDEGVLRFSEAVVDFGQLSLPNLEELSLLRLGSGISVHNLGSKNHQGIYRIPKLVKLELSDSNYIRFEAEEQLFLKGLFTLQLRGFRNLEPINLLDIVSGSHIRELIIKDMEIPLEIVQQIVENGKCLEKLTTVQEGVAKFGRIQDITVWVQDIPEYDSDDELFEDFQTEGINVEEDSEEDDQMPAGMLEFLMEALEEIRESNLLQ